MEVRSVLDKTALFGVLRGELELEGELDSYAVSAITIGDFYSDLIHDHEIEPDTADDVLDQAYTVVPCTRTIAVLAARLRPLTAHHDLTMADRCCIATAMALDLSVTTGNKRWAKLKIAEIDIEVLT